MVEVNMIEIYELRPTREQGQESFYGKALVHVDEDGTETLYSYNTPIISRKPNGQLKRLWFKYSQTTGKHIKAFCGLSKQEFESL